jgi:hypothetical protein
MILQQLFESDGKNVAEHFGPAVTAAMKQGLSPTEISIADRADKSNARWDQINSQKMQQMMAKGLDPTKSADWDKFGKGVAEDYDDFDDEDEESELRSGGYVRDKEDSSGEVFIMRGDPYDRRVQITDRNGSGWNISPSRLVAVDDSDPAIARYFGKSVAEGEKDTSWMNKQSQDFYNKNPNFKRDDRETKSLGNNRLATRVSPAGDVAKVKKKPVTPFEQDVQEAGPYGSRNPDTMSYNEYDRYQQDQMDSSKRAFKRREHEAEWEQEKAHSAKLAAQEAGPWYVRKDGKIIKDQQGNPYTFNSKTAANKAALTMMAKPFNKGKEFKLTKNSSDQQTGVAESQLNELFEPTLDYYKLSNGKTVQVSYRPTPNQSPIPLTDVEVSYVNPALKPQGPSFDSTGVAKPWTSAPDGVKQAIQKFATQPTQGVAEGSLNEGQYEMMMRNGQVKKFIAKDDADAKRIAAGHGAKSVIKLRGGVPAGKVAEQGVAEATGDPKFDKMLKGITGKRAVAKQQKADTKQQARDAFGGMFGRGNPTDQLGIKKKGVDESRIPTKLDLWNRAKMVAESKFHGANKHSLLFATKWYQQHGGTWKS